MTDRIISFDLAKLAKVKGFSEPTFFGYKSGPPDIGSMIGTTGETVSCFNFDEFGDCSPINWNTLHHRFYKTCSAPSLDTLQTWLLEEHNIQVYVCSRSKNGEGKYRDFVAYVDNEAANDPRDEEFQTRFAALDFGLRIGLEKLKDARSKDN